MPARAFEDAFKSQKPHAQPTPVFGVDLAREDIFAQIDSLGKHEPLGQ